MQLLRLQAGPPPVHLASAHRAADDEQRAGVPVIRAARPVLARHAPELRHRQDDHVVHAVAEIGDERRHRGPEVGEPRGELAGGRTLVHMRIPASDIGERHFDSHVRLDQLRDLQQPLTELRARILRTVLRRVALRIRRAQHLHGIE